MRIKGLGRELRALNTTIVAVSVVFGLTASLPAGAQEADPTPASSPSGGDRGASDKAEGDCVADEIVSLRTRDSKTIQNADCSYTATFEQYTHYEAEPGLWEDVDLRFHQQGPDWIADNHDVIVKVAGATVTATDRSTGEGIRWITPGEPTVSDRKASFSHQGLEWSYFTTKPGLKLVARVSAPRGPQTYSFPYALVGKAPDFTVDAGGNLRSGNIIVPRAGALGADGKTYEAGTWRLLPGNRVAFDFDDSSFPAAAFPYELDPTTVFEATSSPDTGGTGQLGTWFTSYPPACERSYTTPVCCSSAQIDVERSRGTDDLCPNCYRLSNGLARWNTSALPDTATINTTKIEVGSTGETGVHDVRNLTADWYTSWPIDCADHTVTAQTSALGGIPLKTLVQDYVGDGYMTIPLDNTNGVSRTGFTGVRFHVSGGQLSSYEVNKFTFHGYGSTQRIAPRLIVTYDNAAPNISSVSDSPDPVVPGSSVTFTVGWVDANGDSVKPVICKTNSVSAGSCPGGTWAVGALRSSSPSTATYQTSTLDVGTRAYYAFACDAVGACSPALSGSFTVNTPPTISSASDSPDPVGAGSPVTFSVGWSDADQGESAKAVICKTNAISSGTCSGGSWAIGTLTSTSPSAATYTTSSADVGTKTYYAFACDQRNSCSSSVAGTFQVLNQPPVINFNVTPTSGDRSTIFNASLAGTYDPNNDPISYRIDWGDGTVNHSQSASHSYRSAGTFTVTGRACDSFGACSTSSRTVTVAFSNRPPNANLTVSPKAGDTQTPFSATLTGSDPDGDSVSYRIDWGDGTTTSGRDGTHTYRSPGRYDVVGTVTDHYGLAGSDEETVTVCAVYQGGQCVETPERPKPPPLPLPGPVSSTLARVLQQRPDATKIVRSATNSIMVLNANLIQAYARGHPEYTATCTATSHKTCGAGMRLERFVDRIEALVEKPATENGDGMGGVVPDVIVLQEVLTPHADAIAKKLSSRFDMSNRVDFMFETAMSFDQAEIPNQQAERKYCAEQNPGATPAQTQECEGRIITKGDVAIIYNHDTVEVMPGTQRVVENRYSPDERCTPPATAPPGGWDFDNDNQADCRFAKWKHQVAAGFAEIRRNGTTTGYTMAVASTHLVTASHFDGRLTAEEVEEGVEEEPEANPNHERRKLQWSDQVAREIATIPADSYVIAGDLNIHRCATKNHKERGDYPQGATCGPRGWYTNLTSEPAASPLPPPGPAPGPTAEPAPEPRGYADTIWFLHNDEDDRLVPQYRDGLLGGGAGERFRNKRIDYIFSRSAELLGSSFDLTCGQNPPRGIPPNCFDDYRNPDYYSDHRIIWTLMSDG